jgi:hypothetical protein
VPAAWLNERKAPFAVTAQVTEIPTATTHIGAMKPTSEGQAGIAPPSWTVDRLGGLRGHGKFLGRLLLIVDGRLVSNR